MELKKDRARMVTRHFLPAVYASQKNARSVGGRKLNGNAGNKKNWPQPNEKKRERQKLWPSKNPLNRRSNTRYFF
jgi:hypothetical protein